MQTAPIPSDEQERLASLHSYGILDSLDEKEYDDIAQLVAQICGTPMANISFVDRDRQWFKAVVGLEDRETSRSIAFCGHTILGQEILTVEDARQDERFHDNPLVTGDPGIRFYAGMPLVTSEGHRLGALCAIDARPRHLSDTQLKALEVLSRHVVALLELRRRNRKLQELSDLKTRLLAIIGHDLRAPLANLSSAVSLLRDRELSTADREQVVSDLGKTLHSAESLLENLVSWAKRNMETETTTRSEDTDLGELGRELVEAIMPNARWKGNAVTSALEELPPLRVDRDILEFILRNLLVNANKFTEGGSILLAGESTDDQVTIRVSDTGIGMRPDQVNSLFDWQGRSRVPGTRGEKGSGLALLLSKDMADQIGAVIEVESEPDSGTTFTLRVPRS